MLRGSGIEWDLRKKQPYEVYDKVDSTSRSAQRRLLRPLPGAHRGDAPVEPHRAAVRGLAARQSRAGDDLEPQGRAALARRDEGQHGRADPPLKLFTEGMHVPEGECYAAVEHPKGEFGIYLISDGANKPYRLKIRAPGFPHLAAMDEMSRGHMIADAVAIIGTMDIVFGEIDRRLGTRSCNSSINEVQKYPAVSTNSAAVMSALIIAQDEKGWLSTETMDEVAAVLGMAPVRCTRWRLSTACTT
jgi:NADH-quinone oxidoreductase subunit D